MPTSCSTNFLLFTMGAFHYARPTGQRPVNKPRENGTTLFDQKKLSIWTDWSVPFTFQPKFRFFLGEVELNKSMFENGTPSFGRIGQTGQRGPPLEVDHFDRKISTRTEAFHFLCHRNIRKIWYNGKHPWSTLRAVPNVGKYFMSSQRIAI